MQWLIQGSPGTGYYAVMGNQSRREYHKAVKYLNKKTNNNNNKKKTNNKNRDMIKRMKFINASLESDKNIFKEIRKLKAGKSTLPNNIDGCSKSEGIANVFSVKYIVFTRK